LTFLPHARNAVLRRFVEAAVADRHTLERRRLL
jgi:hypothetical protein